MKSSGFFGQVPAEKISAIAEIVQMLHNASLLIGKENRYLKKCKTSNSTVRN
jgi:hypothetical protein